MTKETRISIKVPAGVKRIIKEAAKATNKTLSSYIISACLKQAKLDLEQNETIVLKDKERDLLMKILDKPSSPNDALINLFK